jgi:DNA polymerase-3 subunit delta'
VDALRSALKSSAVHHAYLFAGPEGVGKELAAIGFAQALSCQEQPGEGCEECSSCRRIARRNHPDLTSLMPQEEMISRGLASRSEFTNTPSRDIRVEQVRALQHRLALRALEGNCKLAIISSAHQMNAQAQNAFLKTLEEPTPGTVLILISSAPDRLLATIRSRCTRIDFGPLPASFIAEKIRADRNLDPATAELIAALAEGSLARALALEGETLAGRKELVQLFETASAEQPRSLLQFSELFGSSREQAEEAMTLIRAWLRDLLATKVGFGELLLKDLGALAKERSEQYSETDLHGRFELLQQAATAMAERNASPRLQLERMLIEMGRRR